MAINHQQFDNILRRRLSAPPNTGQQKRMLGIDEVLERQLGMRPRIANVRQAEPLPPAIEPSTEPVPIRYYERPDSTPISSPQRLQEYQDRELTFIPNAPHEHLELADFRPEMLQNRSNPTLPDKAANWMLRKDFEDRYNPEVVKALEASAIRYSTDPNTGQRIPVSYNVKARDAAGNPTAWDVAPMSDRTFGRLKAQQSIPIADRKIIPPMPPGMRQEYEQAVRWGEDTSQFVRPLNFDSVPFTPKDFYTVDESLRNVDALMKQPNQADTINDLNLIPENALNTAASPNYAGIGQRSIMVSDQGRINDQYREEWGDDIPNSPHLQNKRAFMPASDRLMPSAHWKTQPLRVNDQGVPVYPTSSNQVQPQNVRQIETGYSPFDPTQVKGFTTPQAPLPNAPGTQITPSSSIDPIQELWQQNRPGATKFNPTNEFITPQVLAADAAYQENVKYDHLFDNIADEVNANALRNRRVESIAPQPRPEIQSSTIPGAYIPAGESYSAYAPRLNSAADDYDWDAMDADLANVHIELDGKHYPLTPSGTIEVGEQSFYNNLSPDILTAIGNKQQELNRIQAKMNELRSSPTAVNSQGQGQYDQLMTRAYQLQSGIETATSAHNKLIGLEPLPEVRVTANRLPVQSTAEDPEITAMYRAGLADRRERIGTPIQPIEVIGDAEIGKALYPIRNARGAADEMAQFIEQRINYPMSAADAAYESFTGQRRWAKAQPQQPTPGIEGSFGRLRAAAPRTIAPADPRFTPDPFASPAQSSAFASPVVQPQRLALPPAAEVPVSPTAPPRTAAEAAFRQWRQPQPQTIDVPAVAASPSAAPQPQLPNQLPSWAIPAAAGAGLITVGGLGAAYYQHQQQKQAEDEVRMRRAMGRG